MSTLGNLLPADVEHELRASVRKLLDDRGDVDAALARAESDEPYDLDGWRRLAADVGVAALPVPEELGGAGATWRETSVVAEEIGRRVAALPFLGSGVLATAALLACEHRDLLTELASGEKVAALTVPLSTAPGARFVGRVVAAGGVLRGTVTSVADATAADVLVVPVLEDGAPALFVADAAAATMTPAVSMDLTRPVATVTFDGTSAQRLSAGTAAAAAVQRALTVGAAMLASEQLGVAQRCLDLTVSYLKTRYQFGRPVGSFQALKHRLADLWVSVTQARAVARYAAVCVAEESPDTAVAVAIAQSHCSAVAVKAAEECIQMHGGIGFTWEHPAHLYLKRAKTSAVALGTPDHHRAALARLVDLPPPA